MVSGLWFPAYGFRFIFDDLFGNLINGVAADA